MSTTLITGASSGIGCELAERFAADGDDVVLVARREDALRSLADQLSSDHDITATVIVADLSKQDAVANLVDQLTQRQLQVDTLVNNAGFGALGEFASLNADRQHDMLMVNVVALTDLTRVLLPGMLSRRVGGVLNVGSVAAYQSGPYMSVYYATKAYVLSFTEALQHEVAGTGVTVTLLAPGATKTGFGQDSGMGKLKMFQDAAMEVEAVAAAGHGAYRVGKPIIIPGWKNRLMLRATHLIPRHLKSAFVAKLQKPGDNA